jgi:CRP-like cAMP-binding protein
MGGKVMADQKVDTLRSVSLFAGCTKKELASIARICTEVRFAEGDVLTKQGAIGKECFVIADGEAEVRIDERSVARLGPGQFAGEMSLLDGGPRTATVTALTPITAFAVSPGEFRSMLDTGPVARKLLTVLAGRLREAEAGELF